ncbi:MAG: exodeoxyribonuclease I [Buchnera aphidicola (Melaphis rhois)]
MSDISASNSFTLLFYDYETFGTNPSLDKPAQFACIRTDLNFNIIEIPNEFFCYPPIDYLPDPQSVLITGITPNYTKKYGLNEFEFSRKICKQFTKPNTCIIGYNNIRFDDEITRNIFYRNFIDPYEWSWKNGNSRWDILDVLRACYALRPDGIHWPINKQKNLPSFKLSDISKANKINHDQVHSAISDVYATLEISKLIKKKQPKLFNYFFIHRNKKTLLKNIDIYNIIPMVYISQLFGAIRSNISIIAPILWHPHNSNILISFDLTKNFLKFLEYISNTVATRISYSDIFKYGIILVYINRCPILAPISVINIENMARLKIDYIVCKKNLFLIRTNITLKKKLSIIFNKIVKSHFDNVDLQLYSSFFSNFEKKLISVIHQSLKKHSFNRIFLTVLNNKIKLLLTRCLARNYPYLLNSKEKVFWKNHCVKIINENSISQYIQKVLHLLELNKNIFKNVLLLKDLLKYVSDINNNVSNM